MTKKNNPLLTPVTPPCIKDLPLWAQEKIAAFAARPARRVTDLRILGWTLIEPTL